MNKTETSQKLTKDELVKLLIDNFTDENGNLDLSNLNFGDFDGHIYINNMQAKRDILQDGHYTFGDIYQYSHENKGSIYQGSHVNQDDIYQSHHENTGNVAQHKHKNHGDIEDYGHQNKGFIKQKALKVLY